MFQTIETRKDFILLHTIFSNITYALEHKYTYARIIIQKKTKLKIFFFKMNENKIKLGVEWILSSIIQLAMTVCVKSYSKLRYVIHSTVISNLFHALVTNATNRLGQSALNSMQLESCSAHTS